MALMTQLSTSTTTLNTACSSATIEIDPSSLPPPTYNHLDAAQRSRLIRSSRKLGKVLGTTPCVLEAVPSLPASPPITDVASKRRSVPPTPKPTFIDFTSAGDSAPSDNRSRKTSLVSDNGTESCSSHPVVSELPSANYIQHRKASSDALGPLPKFSDSDSVRKKTKRSQPVLRLPPVAPGHTALLSLPSDSPTSSSLFSSEYTLEVEATNPNHAVKTPLPLPISPTSSISLASTDMPPTPRAGWPEEAEDTPLALPEEVLAYPGIQNGNSSESRLRKRRMEKLMRHLGEYVPSELVSGSTRARDALSFSGPPTSAPLGLGGGMSMSGSGLEASKMKDAQSRVMRRVSVLSGQRRRTYATDAGANADNEISSSSADADADVPSPGCLSDPEPFGLGLGTRNTTRIHTVLMRERNRVHVARKEGHRTGERGRERERPLVEDDWTPEAYEDVVKRLRRLK